MENAKPTNVRWGVFFALFVLCSINYVDRAVLSLCMPAIQKDLHLDPALVGVILSAFFWGYASMQIPAGWLTDRFRTDKLIIISAILWGVFQIISGFAATTRVFMFLRVLLGMSESTIYPGGTRINSRFGHAQQHTQEHKHPSGRGKSRDDLEDAPQNCRNND